MTELGFCLYTNVEDRNPEEVAPHNHGMTEPSIFRAEAALHNHGGWGGAELRWM